MSCRNILISISLLFFAGSLQAAKLPELELESLLKERLVKVTPGQNKILMLSFFEDKCRWCLRQMVAFNRYVDNENLSFVMVGVGENKLALRHWAKRAKPKMPVAMASPELLELVGQPRVTPLTLLFDQNGEFITKVTGYMNSEKLSKIVDYSIGP